MREHPASTGGSGKTPKRKGEVEREAQGRLSRSKVLEGMVMGKRAERVF